MTKKSDAPAIRFKGFSDAWEQRKLGDCFTERVESMPDGELISVTINDGIKKFSELGRHDNSNDDKSKYKKVCVGDIAYNSMRMWQGASGYSPYEGIVSPAYTVLSPNSGINSKCLSYQFKLPEMIHTFQVNSQGITSDKWNLKYPALSQIEVFVSKDEQEQAKIAEYFENLDNLITLHQRKFEKLTNVKKSMLEKMFPQNGSSYPEIRFKGFTDPWEQRKVGDLLIERNQQAPMSDEYPLMAFIANEGVAPKGERYDRSALVTDTVNKLYKKTEKGDFIYSSNNLETGSIGLNKYGKACISPVYSIFEPTGIADSDFLGRRLVRKDFINAMVKWRQGVIYGQWRIHESDFLKIEITVPSVEEQRKIGAYLDQLDNLITLHQRECISFTGRADRLILTANKKRTTSSWEQRKFGEITSKYEDPVPTPHDGYYRLGIRSHAKGTFHSYVAKGQELETAQMHRVAAGNFIVNITFGWEHAVAITDKNDAGKLVSHRFPQFSFAEGMVPEFFRYVIVDEKFRHHLWLASPGGAGRNRVLKLDEMLNYLMRFPSRDEQIKIAEFFRHLDNLITLHQRKPFLMKWRTSDANRNQTNRLVL